MMYGIKHKRVFDMTDRELAIYKRQKRERAFLKKLFIRSASVLVLIVMFSLVFKSFTSKAAHEDKDAKCKYYKTINIGFDQSIQDIANDNYDADHYKSVEVYMNEIMKINHITPDAAIVGGATIYIPYYSDIH